MLPHPLDFAEGYKGHQHRPCTNEAQLQVNSDEIRSAVDVLLHDAANFLSTGFKTGDV